MSYDFAVFTPDQIGDRSAVDDLYSALGGPDEPDTAIPEALVQLAEELSERYFNDDDDRFLMIDPAAYPRGMSLCTSFDCIPRTFAILTEMTRVRGLALYDPQYERLYDPRNSVDFDVLLGGCGDMGYLSQSVLEEVFAHPSPSKPWMVLSRGDQHYIQTFFPGDAPTAVEWRDGGPDRHFMTTVDDDPVARRLLWDWANERPGWDAGVDWQKMDFGTEG